MLRPSPRRLPVLARMFSTADVPFDEHDSSLVLALARLAGRAPKLVRARSFPVPADPAVSLTSWSMNEFRYYDVPSPFPTLARGLFTRDLTDDDDDDPRHQIIARGYDKFFNIGEVPWTDWSAIDAHTAPPYALTVKSNGCIIFIAPLSPSTLVVTSKHSLGPASDSSTTLAGESHAQVGHRWLRRHLAARGRTEEALADALWRARWTAVAELCDDDFEEHVLPCPPEKAGLHLHGLNETRGPFCTLPPSVVAAFADEWGLFKTDTVVLQSLREVRALTDDIAKTGTWKGEPIEGFVIRTHVVQPNHPSPSARQRPPYPPGSTFFFKVKFDEPYMMYRDWRELTKILLSAKGRLDDVNLPRSKMTRKETRVYVKWVTREIKHDPQAFSTFTRGKGIIATRDRFLQWTDSQEQVEHSDEETKQFGKTVILPVAIPGCGKTAVSVALAHLFSFGHTQSDDVSGKKPGPAFIKNVTSLLSTHDVVIADKNNHLLQHREALRTAVAKFRPAVRLVALHWTLDQQPLATVQRICGDRILGRGDKHQTLRADTENKTHEDVVLQFLRDRQELGTREVDETIDLDVNDTLETTIVRAVDGCVALLDVDRPSPERIAEATRFALAYEPRTGARKKDKKDKGKKDKEWSPRYYAILPELDLAAVVDARLRKGDDDASKSGLTMWEKLVAEERVTTRPHVTLVHTQNVKEHEEVWELCRELHRMREPPLFVMRVGYLLWTSRVMTLTVDEFAVASLDDQGNGGEEGKGEGENECRGLDPGQEGHGLVERLPEEVRDGLHITVGTADPSIPPIEARELVEAWRRGETENFGVLEMEAGLKVKGRVNGLMG